MKGSSSDHVIDGNNKHIRSHVYRKYKNKVLAIGSRYMSPKLKSAILQVTLFVNIWLQTPKFSTGMGSAPPIGNLVATEKGPTHAVNDISARKTTEYR